MNRRIAYLLLEPPRYSESFILNEILSLFPFGFPSRVYCLRGAPDRIAQLPQQLVSITETLPDASGEISVSFSAIADVLEQSEEKLVAAVSSAFSKMSRRRHSNQDARKIREPLWKVACALRVAACCRRDGISHLHCHYANAPAEVGLLVKNFSGVTYSFTGHAKDIFTTPADRLARVIEGAENIVCCSETGATFLRDCAPDFSNKIRRVYHGIKLEDWNIKHRSPQNPPLIVAVGRLTPKKGFQFLVEAVSILTNRGISIEAEIIGEGRERTTLLQVIEAAGLENRVKLAGQMSQEKIRERLSAATVFVLPSVILPSTNQDGVSNAVLEAMAAGVPVIVSDVPGLREVARDGENALVFPSGSAEALANQIARLIGDPALQQSLVAAARRRVAEFDSRSAAAEIRSVLESNA